MTTLQSRLRVQHFSATYRHELLKTNLVAGSLRLARCPIHAVDGTITSVLEELCRIEGADHAGWFASGGDSRSIVSYSTASVAEEFRKLIAPGSLRLPWCRSQLAGGRTILFSDLTDLPLHALADRDYLDSLGIQSLAMIPAERGDLGSGVFVLWAKERCCRWSSSLSHHCSVMGASFLGAHARKLIGLEREDSDTHFREIFRNASSGMALEDTSGRMLFVNEALCKLLGFTEAEMMRMTCSDFSHPADSEREAGLFESLLRGEHHSYQMEKRFLHRNGATVWGKLDVTMLRGYSNNSPVVLGVVDDITAEKAALERLTISQIEVKSLASRLILSQEEERQRLARELHDDIGQRLSLVTSEVQVLRQLLSTKAEEYSESLETICSSLDALVSDVHGLSHRLHSSKLQHLGIASALRELCAQMTRSGLRTTVDLAEELEPVSKDASLCLYRIAQEALANALKHSGADSASVNLSKTPDEYRMVISDAGRGFATDTPAQGLGLVSMRERVMSLQGQLSLMSFPGRGTRITVRIPHEDRSLPDKSDLRTEYPEMPQSMEWNAALTGVVKERPRLGQ